VWIADRERLLAQVQQRFITFVSGSSPEADLFGGIMKTTFYHNNKLIKSTDTNADYRAFTVIKIDGVKYYVDKVSNTLGVQRVDLLKWGK
jgi:hypothetical protein